MKKNKKQLKGFIQSGMLFIGDPGYMAGDMSQPGAEELSFPHNPFYNFNDFTDRFADQDTNLGFNHPHNEGKGVVLANHIPLNGKYEVKKTVKKDGTIEIKIIISP